MKMTRTWAAALVAAASMGSAHAGLLVSSLSDPFAAGNNMVPGAGQGAAPPALALQAGTGRSLTFDVTGSWNCCTATGPLNTGADGRAGEETHVGNVNRISGTDATRVMFLAGVFLAADGNGNPVLPASTPARTQYMTDGAFQATSFSNIGLGQIFFIGDGYTGLESWQFVNGTMGTATSAASRTGSQQVFDVPDAAAFLYLGVVDGCSFGGPPSCYQDNTGSMDVTVNQTGGATSHVPEPGSSALLALALTGLAATRRRRKA